MDSTSDSKFFTLTKYMAWEDSAVAAFICLCLSLISTLLHLAAVTAKLPWMRYYHLGRQDVSYRFILYDTFWHVCRTEDNECFTPESGDLGYTRTMDTLVLYGLIVACFAAACFGIALPLIRMQLHFHVRRLLRFFAVLFLLSGAAADIIGCLVYIISKRASDLWCGQYQCYISWPPFLVLVAALFSIVAGAIAFFWRKVEKVFQLDL